MKRFLVILLFVLSVVWARNIVHTLNTTDLVTREYNTSWSTNIDGEVSDNNVVLSLDTGASTIYTKPIDFSYATGSAVLRIGCENDVGTMDFKVYAYYATVQNEDTPTLNDAHTGGWAYKSVELGEITSDGDYEYNLLDYPELQAPIQKIYFKIEEIGTQSNGYSLGFTYVTEN